MVILVLYRIIYPKYNNLFFNITKRLQKIKKILKKKKKNK